MRALSILQPYAWLIVTGRKDIENRTWATAFRGRILVHAGKKYGKRDYAQDRDLYHDMLGHAYPEREAMIGCIVGEVTIVECVRDSTSRWFKGPVGFVLADAVQYDQPIPYRGQLGFFEVDIEAARTAAQEPA